MPHKQHRGFSFPGYPFPSRLGPTLSSPSLWTRVFPVHMLLKTGPQIFGSPWRCSKWQTTVQFVLVACPCKQVCRVCTRTFRFHLAPSVLSRRGVDLPPSGPLRSSTSQSTGCVVQMHARLRRRDANVVRTWTSRRRRENSTKSESREH